MMDDGLTPLKATRRYCLACCLDQPGEVRVCPCAGCPPHPYRFGRKPKNEHPELTALKAIRARCLDCSAYSSKDVRECVIPGCALHPYRLGKNPKRAGIGGRNLAKPVLTDAGGTNAPAGQDTSPNAA